MIEPAQLLLFTFAAAALVMAPGPDMLLVLGRALGQGRSAAFLAALGCAVGVLFLSLMVALGVTALLQTSQVAFVTMKFAGAAYLVWLGIKTLRDRSLFTPKAAIAAGSVQVFATSLIGNVVNPKVALFMFAFLPQFADHRSDQFAGQVMLLGCVYALLTVVAYGILGAVASKLSDALATRRRVIVGLNLAAGVVFLLSGLRIATFEQPR